MALMMVHLLTARRWAEVYCPEFAENPDFYLGVMAPDGIYVRDKGDKSHKNEIHLNNWNEADLDSILDYWHKHHTAFDIGYGVHCLTDAVWAPRYRKLFPPLVLDDGTIDAKTYYHDTDIVDYELYETNAMLRHLLEFTDKAIAPEDHPQLTAYEISEWRRFMQDAYKNRTDPERGTPLYLDMKYTMDYIRDAIVFIDGVYRKHVYMESVLDAIESRRSTRGFDERPLTKTQTDVLMEAALASPTARNTQYWHFTVVSDKNLIDEINHDFLAESGRDASFHVFYNAPAVVFISAPKENDNRFMDVDVGIACQNIVLAAQAMGLGTVIIGLVKSLFTSEKGDYYREKLKFPEGYDFGIAICLGHNTVTKQAHEKHPEKINYME